MNGRPEHPQGQTSLVAQGFDEVEPGGAERRIQAEDDPHPYRHGEAHGHGDTSEGGLVWYFGVDGPASSAVNNCGMRVGNGRELDGTSALAPDAPSGSYRLLRRSDVLVIVRPG